MRSKQNALLVATELFVSVVNKDKLSLDIHVDSSKHKRAVRFTFFCSLA